MTTSPTETPTWNGHIWNRPYVNGYATCVKCKATENTKEAATPCQS